MGDFMYFIILIVAVLVIYSIWSSSQTKSLDSSASAGTSKAHMVEDIKSQQTQRVADAVDILKDLGSTSSSYRHYCELIGTSQKEGGITAPYSQRQVAYYDVRCYRIEYKGGQEVETLVAQESSFDPFYFKDDSSETPIYVDLASFGQNVILVNSTNHIESPDSEFAQKVSQKISSATKGGSGAALAIVGSLQEKLGNLLGNFRYGLDSLLAPEAALSFSPELALAGAHGQSLGSNMLLAKGPGNIGGHNKAVTSRGGLGGRPSQQRRSSGHVTINLGGLGGFLGGYGYGYGQYPGGYYRRGYDLGDAMLDIGLGALLGSLSNASRQSVQQTTTPQSTFRGYRLVENVVPLGSPIYCIGEIYQHGTDVYMGASTSKEYSTSFFATKPEAEVLSHLGA